MFDFGSVPFFIFMFDSSPFSPLSLRQDFLSDEDFEATLSMSRDAFSALPKWKREKAKKAAGIF